MPTAIDPGDIDTWLSPDGQRAYKAWRAHQVAHNCLRRGVDLCKEGKPLLAEYHRLLDRDRAAMWEATGQ